MPTQLPSVRADNAVGLTRSVPSRPEESALHFKPLKRESENGNTSQKQTTLPYLASTTQGGFFLALLLASEVKHPGPFWLPLQPKEKRAPPECNSADLFQTLTLRKPSGPAGPLLPAARKGSIGCLTRSLTSNLQHSKRTPLCLNTPFHSKSLYFNPTTLLGHLARGSFERVFHPR